MKDTRYCEILKRYEKERELLISSKDEYRWFKMQNVDLYELFDAACEEKIIKYRLTVLMAGMLEEENSAKTVARWLKLNSFERLNVRNITDAVFIYAYKLAEGKPRAKKSEILRSCIKEYGKWEKERRNDCPKIETVKDLTNRLALSAEITQTGTMKTMTLTSLRATEELDRSIAEGKSLSEFLDYLNNDISVRAYRKRSTYYLQRMLYDMLKSGVDVLCDHRIDSEKKAQYDKARETALKHEREFKRYLNENNLQCLKDFSVTDFLAKIKNAPTDREKVMKTIEKCTIGYESLFTGMYGFYTNCGYTNLKAKVKDLEENPRNPRTKDEAVKLVIENTTGIKIDKHNYLLGSLDSRTRMAATFEGYISGKYTAGRTFLVLFGFYAGYNAEKIDYVLERCEWDVLDTDDPFDRVVIECSRERLHGQLRDAVNTPGYIYRLLECVYTAMPRGYKEREAYDRLAEEFAKKAVQVINEADESALKEIFARRDTEAEIKKINSELRALKKE